MRYIKINVLEWQLTLIVFLVGFIGVTIYGFFDQWEEKLAEKANISLAQRLPLKEFQGIGFIAEGRQLNGFVNGYTVVIATSALRNNGILFIILIPVHVPQDYKLNSELTENFKFDITDDVVFCKGTIECYDEIRFESTIKMIERVTNKLSGLKIFPLQVDIEN